MFNLIKQALHVLLNFSSSLACVAKVQTKYLSLNDKPCMVRLTLFDLNLFELNSHPFMISLDKYNGSYNV